MTSRLLILSALVVGFLPSGGSVRAEPVIDGEPLSSCLAWLCHGDRHQRGSAATRLGPFGPSQPGVADALVAALDDPDSYGEAARALGKWGSRGLKLLLPALRDGPTPTRQAVAGVLADSTPPVEALPGLRTALRDTDPYVRAHAALAIHRAAPAEVKGVVTVLCQTLTFPLSDDVADRAAHALIELGPRAREAVPTLRDVLRQPPADATILPRCVRVFPHIRADQPAEAENLLKELLKHSEETYRVAAARALVEMGHKSEALANILVPHLHFLAGKQSRLVHLDPAHVPFPIVVRLGSVAVPALLEALDHPTSHVAAGAAEALAHFEPLPESAIPSLQRLLRSEDESLRRWAAVALCRVPSTAAVARPLLIDAVGDWGGQRFAGWDVYDIHDWHGEAERVFDAEAVPDLIAGLEHMDEDVRAGCAALLPGLGHKARAAIPALRECLKRSSTKAIVSAWVAIALVRLGEDAGELVPELLKAVAEREYLDLVSEREPELSPRVNGAWKLLIDHGPNIRPRIVAAPKQSATCAPAVAVLAALARTDSAARRDLGTLLRDDDLRVRLHAASAVWELDHRADDVLPILRDGLRSDNEELRRLAVSSARKLGPEAHDLTPLLLDRFRLAKDENEAWWYLKPVHHIVAKPAATLTDLLAVRDARDRAAFYLRQLGAAAIPSLATALNSADADVRASAVEVLAEMLQPTREIRELLRVGLHDVDAYVAATAAHGLWKHDQASRESGPILRSLLTSPDARARALAAKTLGFMGPDQAAVTALRRALHDPDSIVRQDVVRALTTAPDAVPDLQALLRHEQDADVSSVVVFVLGHMAATGVEKASIQRTLLASLHDRRGGVRAAAAKGLGLIKSEEPTVVPALLELLTDPEEAVCRDAMTALHNLPPTAEPALRMGLCHRTATVRRGAASALGKLGDAAVPSVPMLAALLDDSEEDVRWEAMGALKTIGPKAHQSAGRVVRALLQDPKDSVRRSAAETLGEWKLRSAETVAGLSLALADADEEVGQLAVKALAALPPDDGILRALGGAVGDPRGQVGLQAARAMAKSGAAGRRFLTELLSCEKTTVRLHTVQALAESGQNARDTAPALLALLKVEKEDDLRGEVAEALSLVGGDGAAAEPLLTAMLRSDQRAGNRAQAALALGRLGLRDAVPVLRETLRREDDQQVRQSVVQSLLTLRR